MVLDGEPVVLPTGYGRDGDVLYLHGSTGAASLRAAVTGAPVSLSVTRVDGIVDARSGFHHSMNYASAVVHGIATPVIDPAEKVRGLAVLTEYLAPGSWNYSRRPSRKELAATMVLRLSLLESAVKVRQGPPGEEDDDVAADADRRVWAGVLPLHATWGEPQPCPLLPPDIPVPEHIRCRTARG